MFCVYRRRRRRRWQDDKYLDDGDDDNDVNDGAQLHAQSIGRPRRRRGSSPELCLVWGT